MGSPRRMRCRAGLSVREEVALSIDPTFFRQVVGSFASGVTVIATGREGAYHGMTASAFTSLSLDPTMVLVCVDRTAETLPFLQAAGAFSVNILTADQEEVSRQFASKSSPQAHGLEGIDFRVGKHGVPVIRGCLAYLECRTVQQYDGGDHVIFIGEVDDAGAEDGEPLLYFRSRYRGIAPL
jgi:flavin reductase (DIM6/NTAB) family NADH-FMN oxidoreductase RutF